MAPRAIWKGMLKVAEVTCPVALHAAASTSDRVAFHTVNRATGHRVQRRYVDASTGKPVPREDQVKGYERTDGDYVLLDDDEIAAAVPESDKTLDVAAFIACDDVDALYFDRPYFLTPAEPGAAEAYALIRDGMARAKVAALARTVLFRRLRSVMIRPHDGGLIATTLNFDHEVRPADEAFAGLADAKIPAEMLDLAKHIVKTKTGTFDPAAFDDRYDAALADLVRAKIEGRKLPRRKAPKRDNVFDLMASLRESAKLAGKDAKPAKPRKSG